MKVFGDTNFAFNSEILQGLDWAVSQDHVNVLSESFGGNPVPNPGNDPIAVFDQDAVNAGITVVVSSGDAGVTNTIGTPAVDPGVISAGRHDRLPPLPADDLVRRSRNAVAAAGSATRSPA